jgi:hypothetical protein
VTFSRIFVLFASVLLFSFTTPIDVRAIAEEAPPSSGTNQDAAKSAFESAKELGTTDAWNAFLASYPNGFYADMARAYLKKVTETQPSTPAELSVLAPSSSRAGERSCAERKELRSQHSREPTKITFINKSGMYRAIMWIDFDGSLKDYGGLNSGEKIVLDTFRTHPWMIATGPGDCLQIFLPAAEPATVELLRLDADDAPSRPAADTSKRAESKKSAPREKLICAENYKLKNGECVLLQNCGKNAYRSVKSGGKCQWPQDKKGFEVAPWKKGGCSSWQAQCSQGNAAACGKYESNCQVN